MARRRQSVSVQEEDAFKMVVDELMEELAWHPSYEDTGVAEYILKMVDYNVKHGKQIRGRGVISAFKSFGGATGKESLKPIYILGWCVELLGAAFYIPEDVIRKSVKRRGQLCWHLSEEIGISSVNDSFLMQSIMYFFLDRHFKGKPGHKFLTQIFHKCFFTTSMGQNMGCRMAKNEGFEGYTMDNYIRAAKNKAGYFSFYLPMSIGKIMAEGGKVNSEELKVIEEISLEMGLLFQAQDDYLDCFGNPAVTGRLGTTIEGNYISWFIVKALQKANADQHKILEEHYGRSGTDHVHRVIKLFREMGLMEDYAEFEMESYKATMASISKMPASIPILYFSETLDLILKRDK